MAKADGVAVLAEEQAFERFLELKPEDASNVRRLYALAKANTAGFEIYAARIGRLLAKEPSLKINVLECLLYVACSDGVLHPAEDAFLRTVAEKFGVPDRDFKRLRAMFVHDPHCPYDLLGHLTRCDVGGGQGPLPAPRHALPSRSAHGIRCQGCHHQGRDRQGCGHQRRLRADPERARPNGRA